jgi:hypothetical protein
MMAILTLVLALLSQEGDLQPFAVEWPGEARSPADLSALLDAPAGKGGFIRAEGGHLVRPGGKRLRIWGVNVSARAAFPPKEDAPLVAARLARAGINGVRFHYMDVPSPRGLIDSRRDDTRALDADSLDRLDFFVAELKKRGIYANLNLNVGRRYKPGDGVREHEFLGVAKAATFFDERLLELQREYARQLLTHRNPYTGTEYREEPAVAIVEFVNENSLVEAWMTGRLLGENTKKPGDVWNDIPPSYGQALTEKYNAWLTSRLGEEDLSRLRAAAGVAAGEPVPRLKPKEFGKAPRERFLAEAEFYLSVEKDYFLGMARFLREELKVRACLVGNSDHGHSKTGYPQLAGTSLLDVVDSHVYWQHPNTVRDPKTGRALSFEIGNTPMVDDPLRSTVVQLSRSAVAGKPFTVSEANHPFPNEYACEGLPILAAYGALQDWDGIFAYTLAHDDILKLKPVQKGHFDHAMDPVKMAQLSSGAMIFLRGDVRPAAKTMKRSYTRDQVKEGIRLPGSERPYFTPGFPLAAPLEHAVRVASFDGPPTGTFPGGEADPIRSDTGELAWHRGEKGAGLVVIDAEKTQGLVGFVAAGRAGTRNLAAEVSTRFCAIVVGALDDRPVGMSGRLLLTAGSKVANAGMAWNAKRTSLENWGKEPSVIEPVRGRLLLSGLEGARRVEAQPLDGAGQPLGPPVAAAMEGGSWSLPLGKPPTPWFVLNVSR